MLLGWMVHIIHSFHPGDVFKGRIVHEAHCPRDASYSRRDALSTNKCSGTDIASFKLFLEIWKLSRNQMHDCMTVKLIMFLCSSCTKFTLQKYFHHCSKKPSMLVIIKVVATSPVNNKTLNVEWKENMFSQSVYKYIKRPSARRYVIWYFADFLDAPYSPVIARKPPAVGVGLPSIWAFSSH